ncbi:hypothetical protein PFISCL1PPCAC_25876, partial [Pristionchus fissidentatus]
DLYRFTFTKYGKPVTVNNGSVWTFLCDRIILYSVCLRFTLIDLFRTEFLTISIRVLAAEIQGIDVFGCTQRQLLHHIMPSFVLEFAPNSHKAWAGRHNVRNVVAQNVDHSVRVQNRSQRLFDVEQSSVRRFMILYKSLHVKAIFKFREGHMPGEH